MNDSSVCPCDAFQHPKVLFNPPGRNTIAYRIGDYLAFRHALLLARPGETELAYVDPGGQTILNWRPSAKGDLALQMMEWWAYLADILTFYNERIANQDYLRTADLPESVQRLIRVLGYRPRPGIGATGTLAALMSGPKPFLLPQGFQVQSKPGPGKQPQVFELDADTLIHPPDAVPADPVPSPFGSDDSVLLKGTVTTVKVGNQLLLLENGWPAANKKSVLVSAQKVSQETDPGGITNTRVKFNESLAALSGGQAKDFSLLKSTQSAHVWQYPAETNTVIQARRVDLESIRRDIKLNDPVLFQIPHVPPTRQLQLVRVTSYTEAIYYANPKGYPANPSPDPSVPPDSPPAVPIAIPHTRIRFAPPLFGIPDDATRRTSALVHFAWQSAGQLIDTPAITFDGTSPTLVAVPPATFPAGSNVPLMIEDADGNGVPARGSASADQTTLQLSNLPDPLPVPLTAPLRVLFDLLSVSRGKVVANEVLGNGDATVAGQEFVLQKSPLTYLLSPSSTSGASYTSTLRIWVNGVEWKEVPSFYGQAPDAHIFVTREDEQNQTHVQFGDGINGARLPSGVSNVVATYRYGSGREAPDPGMLNVILQPRPGLKAIRNPVAVGGGADPDPPQQIKRYAPQSVLTFGRAISGDDYETIAAQAPGVARARAYWTFDPLQQRTLVTIYVGDDANAVNAAQVALAGAEDPNRPAGVKLATAIPVTLSLTLLVDPNYVAANVVDAATAALLDPETGLLGVNAIQIGQSIYESQIYEACLSVPGAVAVRNLQFSMAPQASGLLQFFRFDPGEGKFFQLLRGNLTISPEVAANAG